MQQHKQGMTIWVGTQTTANGKIYVIWYRDPLTKKMNKTTHKSWNKDYRLAITERDKRYDAMKESMAYVEKNTKYMPKESKTCSKFFADCIEYLKRKNDEKEDITLSTISIYERTARKFIGICGDLELTKITWEDVEKYRDKRAMQINPSTKKQISAVTVNIELRTLRAFWNVVINPKGKKDTNRKNLSVKYKVYDNPAVGVDQIEILPNNEPVLSGNDIAELTNDIQNQDFRDMAMLASLSGMRLNEVLQLQWSDIVEKKYNYAGPVVDLKNQKIKINNKIRIIWDKNRNIERERIVFKTKTKSVRHFSIGNPALFNMLVRRYENNRKITTVKVTDKTSIIEDLVFPKDNGLPYSINYISRTIKNSLKNTGHENYHFHDLRHVFVTNYANQFSLSEAGMIVGHSKIETSKRYYHLNNKKVQDNMNNFTIA